MDKPNRWPLKVTLPLTLLAGVLAYFGLILLGAWVMR